MNGFENETENMKENDQDIDKKIAAMNHETRLALLKIIRDSEQQYQGDKNDVEKYAPTNRILIRKLKDEYHIDIGEQLLGQHINKLVNAGLIEKFQIPDPENNVNMELNAYLLESDAFEDLFLEVNFLNDELKRFIDYSQEPIPTNSCVLTVFNGDDRGKKLVIKEDEEVLIGRKANIQVDDAGPILFLLSDNYTTVSRVSKPHLKIYNKNGDWYMFDDASTNGTYIYDNKHKNEYKLKNNSYIRLSKGPGSAIIYCRFDSN